MKKIFLSFLALNFLISSINTQQNYSGNSVLSCKNSDRTGPSTAFLYTCNGKNTTCPAFLIFSSMPPYNSIFSISNLTSTDPSRLAVINNVPKHTVFPTGKEVIVPIRCLCFGKYYQANTTYNMPSIHESYFTIANNTYQGLSSCDSLKRENGYGEFDLKPGFKIDIPLRCACPTKQQVKNNIKFLLTYSLSWKDNIPALATRFSISKSSVDKANSLGENPDLFPFTTILIPLQHVPESSKTIIHFLDQPIPATRGKKSKTKIIIIAAGLSLLILIVLVLVFFINCLCYKKKGNPTLWEINEGKRKHAISKDLREEIATIDQIRVFEFEDLETATGGFSSKNKIMDGLVYKGVFDGEILAVKKMGTNASEEFNILNKIYHFNVMKLQGVCNHCGCFYLVYEYMQNGSLREWLDNDISSNTETWDKRIQIGLDIANGLNYLHSFVKPAFVHKYITSQNILLDDNLRAKITNFSLARTPERGASRSFGFSTTIVSGTRGYIAPEYVEKGQVSTKIDVYAFGVVLLEIITGKEPVYIQDGCEVLLSSSIGSIIEKEGGDVIQDLIDPCILQDGDIAVSMSVVKLSLRCLRYDPDSRPSMGEVASALSKIQIELQNTDSWCNNYAPDK